MLLAIRELFSKLFSGLGGFEAIKPKLLSSLFAITCDGLVEKNLLLLLLLLVELSFSKDQIGLRPPIIDAVIVKESKSLVLMLLFVLSALFGSLLLPLLTEDEVDADDSEDNEPNEEVFWLSINWSFDLIAEDELTWTFWTTELNKEEKDGLDSLIAFASTDFDESFIRTFSS